MAAISRPFQFRLRKLFLATFAISLPLAGWALVRQASVQQDRSACKGNLLQIAMLLKTYYASHDAFPPACVADAAGKPMHSWRTLILFGYNPRFPPPYALDEPWNGPTNSKFTSRWNSEFVCPSGKSRYPQPVADYAMIVGPGVISSGETSVSLGDIADGPQNTVIVIELVDSDIGWGEPRDISIDDAVQALTGGPQKQLAGRHGGRMLLFADGEIRHLTRPLPEATARGLLTISGGEAVDREELIHAGYFD